MTDAELLALDDVSMRQDAFVFELVDVDYNLIGELHPTQDTVPSLTLDATRLTKRQISGVSLTVSDSAAVNVYTDRVRPIMVLQNGSRYDLGTFMFTDTPLRVQTFGDRIVGATLSDLSVLANVPLAQTVTSTFWIAQVEAAGLATTLGMNVGSVGTNGVCTYPFTAQQGTSVLGAVNQLAFACASIQLFDTANQPAYLPWFLQRCPAPGIEPVEFVYAPTLGTGLPMIDGTIELAQSYVGAVNKWVASSGAGAVDIRGSYVQPYNAPNSRANIGYDAPSESSTPGVSNNVEANLAAQSIALSTPGFGMLTFSSPLDPRHGALAVCSFRDDVYIELGWSMELRSGGVMGHTMRRDYSYG